MFGCLNFLYNQDNISYTSASGYKPHCYSCRWSELPSNFPRTKKKKKNGNNSPIKKSLYNSTLCPLPKPPNSQQINTNSMDVTKEPAKQGVLLSRITQYLQVRFS